MFLLGAAVIASVAFIVVVNTQKTYLPRLPFESMTKKQVYEAIYDSDHQWTYLNSDKGYNWYVYQGNQRDGGRELIARLQEKGIHFKEQLGSGYVFTSYNAKEQMIVESEMWTSRYVMYQVPEQVNLRDGN